MQRTTLRLLASVPLLIAGCSTAGGGGGGGGGGTGGRVAYDIEITNAGSFAPLGEGATAQRPVDEEFGPDAGYPEPESVARFQAGVIERDSFLVFEASNGDLTEAAAAIIDAAERTVASPGLHPNSTPLRIGIEVPGDLPAGPYALELRTPTAVLIAEVTFELEEPEPDEDDTPVLVGL